MTKAWYTTPLPSLQKTIEYLLLAIRMLPEDVLDAELAELTASAAAKPDDIAVDAMRRVYEAEGARRSDQTMAFDDEIELLVERLGRQTNEPDRRRLREIGEALYRLGGVEAMAAAYRRLAARSPDKRRDLADRIIGKFWRGIEKREAA